MKFIKNTKDSSNIIGDIKINKKLLIILHIKIFYYFIFSFIINITNENSLTSKIILTIEGTGNQKILCNNSCQSSNYYKDKIPDVILINNVSQDIKGTIVYNLQEQINNITVIWNSALTDCSYMFFTLSNIIYIDLSNFVTSQVKDITAMFSRCNSLKSINFGNFDTSKVNKMFYMFKDCSSLTSLDLSSFNTSKVKRMSGMFLGCSSLTSLDLSNFNTSIVERMDGMFSGCSSLTSLDLSNFDISHVTNFQNMFSGCNSLKSLYLSNFN